VEERVNVWLKHMAELDGRCPKGTALGQLHQHIKARLLIVKVESLHGLRKKEESTSSPASPQISSSSSPSASKKWSFRPRSGKDAKLSTSAASPIQGSSTEPTAYRATAAEALRELDTITKVIELAGQGDERLRTGQRHLLPGIESLTGSHG